MLRHMERVIINAVRLRGRSDITLDDGGSDASAAQYASDG